MRMRTFEVKIRIDRETVSKIVEAPDIPTAKRVAMADIQGQYGYTGRKITFGSTREIR